MSNDYEGNIYIQYLRNASGMATEIIIQIIEITPTWLRINISRPK